ncbi:MAG TPA: hexose kinase [Solirubrobacteraceae bacterium]|nr:hexose kinase [Solirubrobacteraceae bacterium]
MILCVAGNPSIDRLFEVERLAHGDIHRPEQFVALPGGKGIHVAQVATTLGSEAIATGILAGHAGRWLDEELGAEGVGRRFAWSAGETRSSLSVADRETGRLTEFYESGTPVSTDAWRELEEIVSGLLGGASWLAIAGSLPPGAPDDGYARLISAARGAGVATALDSRGDALERSLDSHPNLLKINAYEAGELLERSISTVDEAHDAALTIHRRAGGGGHATVITIGEQGVVAIDPAGTTRHARTQARGRYPVGSGDALLAGLLVALERGDPWPRALALALGAAAANAESPGAGRLDPARAQELAAQTEMTDLSE